jgi:plasmid replication initiation protein
VESLQDLFERLQKKAATRVTVRSESASPEQPTQDSRLLPDRHPVGDFFIADITDWVLKGDRHSMEHPMFSLSKKPDHKVRRYEHNGVHITIKPGSDGLATIWDKDVLLYCISKLVAALNEGRQDVSRAVRLTAYDLLVTTNRTTGGRSYEELRAAFERLRGTSIMTDITTNGIRQRRGFGLIDNWEIVDKAASGRMLAVEIMLNQWLYNAIVAREVLTLNRDYFRLSGGLERRLYELGRKHCGQQPKWTVSLELLHKKSGSTGPVKRFREMVKKVAMRDGLPDYRVRYDGETDRVLFYTKDVKKLAESMAQKSS